MVGTEADTLIPVLSQDLSQGVLTLGTMPFSIQY